MFVYVVIDYYDVSLIPFKFNEIRQSATAKLNAFLEIDVELIFLFGFWFSLFCFIFFIFLFTENGFFII